MAKQNLLFLRFFLVERGKKPPRKKWRFFTVWLMLEVDPRSESPALFGHFEALGVGEIDCKSMYFVIVNTFGHWVWYQHNFWLQMYFCKHMSGFRKKQPMAVFGWRLPSSFSVPGNFKVLLGCSLPRWGGHHPLGGTTQRRATFNDGTTGCGTGKGLDDKVGCWKSCLGGVGVLGEVCLGCG